MPIVEKKKPTAAQKKLASPWPAKLKKLRAERDLTQAKAAEMVGVALRTWINWESGWQQPSGPAQKLLLIAFTELKTD